MHLFNLNIQSMKNRPFDPFVRDLDISKNSDQPLCLLCHFCFLYFYVKYTIVI